MTDKERTDTQKSLLYDLRLQVLQNTDKDTYSKEEILALFDTVALDKSQK